jgi:hypothetical protein
MPDITLQIGVPEQHQSEALEAFNIVANNNIVLQLRAKGLSTSYLAQWTFTLSPRAGEENNIEFGERVLRELGKAIIKMVDLKERTEIRDSAREAIGLTESDIPEDILT